MIFFLLHKFEFIKLKSPNIWSIMYSRHIFFIIQTDTQCQTAYVVYWKLSWQKDTFLHARTIPLSPCPPPQWRSELLPRSRETRCPPQGRPTVIVPWPRYDGLVMCWCYASSVMSYTLFMFMWCCLQSSTSLCLKLLWQMCYLMRLYVLILVEKL